MSNIKSKCNCGKVKSKYASRCKACDKAYFAKLHAEAQAQVDKGVCPCCGAAIRRNLSMAGWYQCAQYGAEGFRADASKPACSWQVFTE